MKEHMTVDQLADMLTEIRKASGNLRVIVLPSGQGVNDVRVENLHAIVPGTLGFTNSDERVVALFATPKSDD